MLRTALQSSVVGLVASVLALWARYGRHWWPASPLEKAAYRVACPACPYDVATLRPETHSLVAFTLLGAMLYAGLGVAIETARRMRRGE